MEGLSLSDILGGAASGFKTLGGAAGGLKSMKDLFSTKEASPMEVPKPASPKTGGPQFQPSAPYFAAGLPAPEISPGSGRLAMLKELRRRLA